MREPKSSFRILTESGPLAALTVAVALLVGIVGPASAQFFNFGGWSQPQPQPRGGSGWFGGDVYAPFQPPVRRYQAPRRQPPRQILEDFSKAPPPEKRETVPERRILVLGDAMADWLAYGLEDAYAEQPEMGVIRKHKTVSGLIKYQPKGDPADWPAAAKGLVATEKPDAIVVMLGLNDRSDTRRRKTGRYAIRQKERQDERQSQAGGQARRPKIRREAGRRNRYCRKARGQSDRYRIVSGRCCRQ